MSSVGTGSLVQQDPSGDDAAAGPAISLVDLLDRLLGAGVVLSGDIMISIAGVDLVEIRLHALISSVRAGMRAGDDRD